MKRFSTVVLTAMALTVLLVVPALSAPKLVVKDASGNNTVFEVDDTGFTGIGTGATGPTAPLSIISPTSGNLLTLETTSPSGGAGFQFKVTGGGLWLFKGTQDNGFKIRDGANNKDVMYFQTTSGHVGIGTVNPAYPLDVNGQARINGIVYGSSRTIKDNIVELKSSEALEVLRGLAPVKFNYKEDEAESHIGFIAEDVPALVAKNGKTGIDPMDIVAVLTRVVQEQNKTITDLSEKMKEMEAEMARLKSKDMLGRLN